MIREIELTNFKCFSKLELQMKGLNIFSGINSMGKSTVIQSLLLLRQSHENNALNKGLYLNGKYVSIGTGKDLLYSEAESEKIGIRVKRETEEFDGQYEYNSASDYLKRIDKSVNKSSFNLFESGFEFISADRLGPQLSYSKSYYEVHERRSMGLHGEYAVHFLFENKNEKIENEYVLYPGEDNNNFLFQTEKWMSEISPGIRIDFENYESANSVSPRIRQMNKSESVSNYYSIRNVGFGISYVLPIVLSILKAQKGDLLILENPEAHLHPKGQRKMGELVARAAESGVQIILETHSDHLLNGVRLSVKEKVINENKIQVNFFQNNPLTGKKEVLNPTILKDGRMSFWPDGFFDEWDKAIEEMF